MRFFMSRFTLLAVVLALLFSFTLNVTPRVQADTKKVVCDSDLVLSLYIAENNLGFGAVEDLLMQDKSMKMVDPTTIDTGQFTPLFETMMKNMDSSMVVKGTTMSGTDVKAIADLMAHPSDMMKGMDVSRYTALKPAKIAGEPATCTMLRAELNEFYTAVALHGEMMSSSMSATMSK